MLILTHTGEYFLDWRIICRVLYWAQVLLPTHESGTVPEWGIMHDILPTVLNIATSDPRLPSSEPRAVDAREKLVFFLRGIVDEAIVRHLRVPNTR